MRHEFNDSFSHVCELAPFDSSLILHLRLIHLSHFSSIPCLFLSTQVEGEKKIQSITGAEPAYSLPSYMEAPAPPNRILFVENLPPQCNTMMLAMLFDKSVQTLAIADIFVSLARFSAIRDDLLIFDLLNCADTKDTKRRAWFRIARASHSSSSTPSTKPDWPRTVCRTSRSPKTLP